MDIYFYVISGFCHKVVEICALLGYYTVYSGNSLLTYRDTLTLEDGTNRLSQNICEELPLYVGGPKIAATPEIIEQVHDMILDDWWMKVHEIAETIGISKECVGYILHEELDMKRLCARWVPRLFTADQKRTRMEISEQSLEHFNKNKTDFVRRFITMYETWIHHYTLESKQ
jgi:hypothetical protein